MNISGKGRTWLLDLLRVVAFGRHYAGKLRHHALDLKDAFSEFHAGIWKEAAEALSVDLETYPGGFYRAVTGDRSAWIQDYQVPCDPLVMLMLARNKPLAARILRDHGVPVPPFCDYTLNDLDEARAFLEAEDGPCVVKPALDSAGGKGVTTDVRGRREFLRASIFASAFSPRIMIERQIPGDVYRLLILDGELIDAIRRRPPRVTGDGRSTIRELIRDENRRRVEDSGRWSLKVLVMDHDCRKTLRRAGLSLKSRPEAGREVEVKATTNESAAGECENVRDRICPALVADGVRAARALGVRLAGVDIIAPDIGVPLAESGGAVLELNCSPGLHYHYQVNHSDRHVPVAIPILRALLGVEESAGVPSP